MSIFLYTDHYIFFYNDYRNFYLFYVKLNTFWKFKMEDPRWRMVPDPSLTIIDIIMRSLLLLKVTNVLTNFSILSDILLLSIFHFEGEKWMQFGFCP